ncbi:MAG: DNA translocase FtsK 4TM domain-containing protein, partial [Eggerthella sp.]|nr:DNA translocase FtsK 4TM domain-containing protein [Eggerthella sp.]
MARQSSSTAKPKASSATKSKGKAASPAEKRAKQAKGARPQATEEPRLLDERTRRDITGVAFAVLAVVLFVAAVLPTNAVVTSFVSTALHLSLGLGAYLLPFLLLIIGASFLARFDRERVPVRVAVGLVMIFVAALSLLALFTPESAPDSVDRLFLSDELAARGGYLGAGIAWVGISLFGQAVTCIVMIGIVLAGLVIIGFSVSKLVERVQDARRALVADDADDDVLAAPPYARMKRSTGAKVPVVPTTGEVVEAGATNVLPRAKDAKGRPSKPRRASQSLVTQAIGNRAASTEEGGGEAPQTLTRKLGRKHDKSDSSSAAPKPSASSTPLASPRPADGFVLPPADLLAVSKNSKKDRASDAELADTAACLQETLESFAIMAEVVGWVAGPTVTLFKVDLPAGVRVSRITALEQDIALALAAPGVRIFAPIPGTNYVGIEVPNRTRQSVLLGDVIKDADEGPLQIVIGKDV